jgi:hypothetical protein
MHFETIRDFAEWPGVATFDSVRYTCSHGITAGVVTAISRIPPTTAVNYGTFRFHDGNRVVELKECKLHMVENVSGSQGPIYTYRILDRRWRWQFGEISGHYNQRDRRDNLIPWMVKTPTELAEMCLKAMGETGYEIDLPEGLSQLDLDIWRDNPAPGEKTPVTKTNPEVFWEGERPAAALDRLCSVFGRRLVWDYTTGTVKIVKPGYGADLQPMPHLDEIRQHLDQPVKPTGIGVIGANVRVQMRLKLIAVGEEWDGRFLPIEELSYKPDFKAQPGIWTIAFPSVAPFTGTVTIDGKPFSLSGQTSANGAATSLAAMLNNLDVDGDKATATAANGVVTFTVPVDGVMPDVLGTSGAVVTLTQMPISSAWQKVKPDSMFNVKATDRLTYEQARALAQKSVLRYYRVADEDVSCGWDPDRKVKKIDVPRYGEIDRRQQLQILPTLAEQVNPKPREDDRATANGTYLSANPDYYDGYSRDRQPIIYGMVARNCNGDFFMGARGLNTPENRRIAAQFTIDCENQIVIFGRPMYRSTISGSHWRIDEPHLTLETSVFVQDTETNAPVRYRRWLKFDEQVPDKITTSSLDIGDSITVDVREYALAGGLPETFELKNLHDNRENLKLGLSTSESEKDTKMDGIQWFRHDDVPFAVITRYDYDKETHGYTYKEDENESDDVSRPRADYYLAGHVLEHLPKGGQTAVYHGVHQIAMDGAISQVTIEVGSGAKTSASRNAEHAVWLPALPARRRAEGVAANEDATRQNLAEQGGRVSEAELARRRAIMTSRTQKE